MVSAIRAPPCSSPAPPRRQNQLPPVAAMHLGHNPAVLPLSLLQLFAQDPVLDLEPRYAPLEIQDLLHPGEVHPHLLGELLDVATELDVILGVQPRVLYALARAEQTLLLVHPQGLRVNPDKLRGYPDQDRKSVV